jgi:tetratricopeptide (TPR) repeat protein
MKSVLDAVTRAARAGDDDLARRLAREALNQGMAHPELLKLRAQTYEEQAQYDLALADLRRAHDMAPNDVTVLNAYGVCLARKGALEGALQCYDQALKLQPDFHPAWFNRGWVLERFGELTQAAEAYARTIELAPGHSHAWANLSNLALRRGDAAEARTHAERALALLPGNRTAMLVLADADMSDPAASVKRLGELLAQPDLTDYERGLALGRLGDVLDALDQPAEAFAAYARSNGLIRKAAQARFEAPSQTRVADDLAARIAWLEQLDRGRWASGNGAGEDIEGELGAGERRHVFLMGFPRSGTTLIESVLDGCPEVASLEERNTLDAAVRDLWADPGAAPRLETIGERELATYREDYWARVKRFGVDPRGKIVIDKNPFNTTRLPLINRLFPNAKIIFSLRDPRDVVLSCFRRRFDLSAATYELLDLERGALLYDRAMRLAERFRALQPLDEHTLVYERLVEDFAGQAKAACDFIGAEWRPDLIDFAARARRGDVASASSAQIARGLYADGAGQWRRYRAELAPVDPLLRPWIDKFGYPAA